MIGCVSDGTSTRKYDKFFRTILQEFATLFPICGSEEFGEVFTILSSIRFLYCNGVYMMNKRETAGGEWRPFLVRNLKKYLSARLEIYLHENRWLKFCWYP